MDHQSERKKGIERVGGLYDDSQRVWSALSAIDRDAHVISYPGLLEIKSGDSVPETLWALDSTSSILWRQASSGKRVAPARRILPAPADQNQLSVMTHCPLVAAAATF
jgi:hypothetical protein